MDGGALCQWGYNEANKIEAIKQVNVNKKSHYKKIQE